MIAELATNDWQWIAILALAIIVLVVGVRGR